MPWIHYPLHPELGLRFIPEAERRNHDPASAATERAPSSITNPVSRDPPAASHAAEPIPRSELHAPDPISIHLRSSAVATGSRYFLGLDLGQVADFTALAVLRQLQAPTAFGQSAIFNLQSSISNFPSRPQPPHHYELVALKRYPLRTPYPEIVANVRRLFDGTALYNSSPPAGYLLGGGGYPRSGCRPGVGACRPLLIADATGVGPPVIDMFRAAGLDPLAITITGGHTASLVSRRQWHVPKRDLISVVQMLLQSGRLRFAARIPEAAILQRELMNFRVRITDAANETYAAWRENEHDDTVLALALACWTAERGLPRQLKVW